MTPMKVTWLHINIHNAGYIEETPTGYGFSVEEKDGPPFMRQWLRSYILQDQDTGKVYAARELLNYLMGTQWWGGAYCFVGTRRMFQVTGALLESALDSNDYPRRSRREREVQKRNYSLIEWFVKLTNLKDAQDGRN